MFNDASRMEQPSSYFKSTCAHCGGRIEAPSEGAGMWIHCPHCGQKTQLVNPPAKLGAPAAQPAAPAKKSSTRIVVLIGAVCLVIGAMVFAGVAFFLTSARTEQPFVAPAAGVHPGTKGQPAEPSVEPQPDLWNGLKPGPVTIEKQSKGRLAYALGTVRNDTDKQRFGVKVTLDILDSNGEKVGVATDYVQFIDAHKEWNYKALVTASKATSAKVTAITEN
jgi:hypothetical protein